MLIARATLNRFKIQNGSELKHIEPYFRVHVITGRDTASADAGYYDIGLNEFNQIYINKTHDVQFRFSDEIIHNYAVGEAVECGMLHRVQGRWEAYRSFEGKYDSQNDSKVKGVWYHNIMENGSFLNRIDVTLNIPSFGSGSELQLRYYCILDKKKESTEGDLPETLTFITPDPIIRVGSTNDQRGQGSGEGGDIFF